MKLPLAWLREFVDVPDDVRAVAGRLAACGFAVESIDGDVIDFEITANRPDCLSVYGLAREAATAFERPLRPAPAGVRPPGPDGPASVSVSIDDPACGRYALATARVEVGPSPQWLAAKLAAAGVRPVNNVVDITNYVMLEMGHPMHAFDLARLAGPAIHVRRARPGERLVTLDGEARVLDETMLVIADPSAAVAVAGVMGGATSEISPTTRRIALESAWFEPATVRATSRRLNLKTDASARFERGADRAAPPQAIARALALFADTGAGQAEPGLTDLETRAIEVRHVTLTRARLTRVLGAEIPDVDVDRILAALGFAVTPHGDGWRTDVPSFRVDVARDADLIEEVGRHWGFDRIPATFPALRSVPRPSDPAASDGRFVRRILTGAGLQEAVTFTFIEEGLARPFADGGTLVTLQNPLSEKFAVLRPSLVPGLVESLAYNLNRQATDVELFEVGSVFSEARGERVLAGWVLTGSRGTHWSGSAGPITFADTKGVAELLARAFQVRLDVRPSGGEWLAPGAGARLVLADSGDEIGWVGRLAARRDLDDTVYAGEIDLGVLTGAHARRPKAIHPLPRHPAVVRDLSVVVDERLPAADVRGTIRTHAPAQLVDLFEFDRYQGTGVPPGRVSLSLRLTFRDSARTLTDAEVQAAVDTIVAALAHAHGAELRGR